MSGIKSLERVFRALAVLSHHPRGLPLAEVADELGVRADRLRADILDFYTADPPPRLLPVITRTETIEFLAADRLETADPLDAPVIRVASDTPAAELGVQFLDAGELATLYEAAAGLAQLEPDNADLRAALQTLADLIGGGGDDAVADRGIAAVVHRALDQRVAVDIDYSRQWRPGVARRRVHPYAMRHTRRGWELDAGPLEDGHARTYIVERISAATPTTEAFELPPGLPALLAAERAQRRVDLSLPQGALWAAERFAESTEILSEDAEDVTVRVHLLPPVAERVAVISLIAGGGAMVVDPVALEPAVATLAHRLLDHHGLGDVAKP